MKRRSRRFRPILRRVASLVLPALAALAGATHGARGDEVATEDRRILQPVAENIEIEEEFNLYGGKDLTWVDIGLRLPVSRRQSVGWWVLSFPCFERPDDGENSCGLGLSLNYAFDFWRKIPRDAGAGRAIQAIPGFRVDSGWILGHAREVYRYHGRAAAGVRFLIGTRKFRDWTYTINLMGFSQKLLGAGNFPDRTINGVMAGVSLYFFSNVTQESAPPAAESPQAAYSRKELSRGFPRRRSRI